MASKEEDKLQPACTIQIELTGVVGVKCAKVSCHWKWEHRTLSDVASGTVEAASHPMG